MQIGEFARLSGLSAKTIRFYESIGLLATPARTGNNYRHYHTHDLERLRFIAGARTLGLGIETIRLFVTAFEQGEAPCTAVQDTLDQQLTRIDQQIAELLALRTAINQLRSASSALPIDRSGRTCVCALIATHPNALLEVMLPSEAEHDGA